MAIPFTQYLKPNGKKVAVVIDMDEDTEAKAKLLLDEGFHFDIEVLNTDLVSMTCEDDEDIISIEICENGPDIPNAVQRIVQNAYKEMKKQKEHKE